LLVLDRVDFKHIYVKYLYTFILPYHILPYIHSKQFLWILQCSCISLLVVLNTMILDSLRTPKSSPKTHSFADKQFG